MNWLHTLQHWLAIHTGTVNEPGVYYGFWSGFGSDIGEYVIGVGLAAGLYHAFRRHNCHEPRCWRIGLHRVEGTPFIACRKHHPVLLGMKLTKGHMAEAYRRARPRTEDAVASQQGRRDPDDRPPHGHGDVPISSSWPADYTTDDQPRGTENAARLAKKTEPQLPTRNEA